MCFGKARKRESRSGMAGPPGVKIWNLTERITSRKVSKMQLIHYIQRKLNWITDVITEEKESELDLLGELC